MFLGLSLLLFISCGKDEYFGDYVPLTTGSKWTFEDDAGNLAEISVYADSLSSYKDTIFKVFFLGSNIDFLKTPNYVSWRWYRSVVVNDKEIVLEDRFYPFWEIPFISGEKRTIVNNVAFYDDGIYYRNAYSYEFQREDDIVKIMINSGYYTIVGEDTVQHDLSYIFTMVQDTGFKEIIYIKDGITHHFRLVGFHGG